MTFTSTVTRSDSDCHGNLSPDPSPATFLSMFPSSLSHLKVEQEEVGKVALVGDEKMLHARARQGDEGERRKTIIIM